MTEPTKPPQLTLEAFIEQLRGAGLDPAAQDTAAMHLAWIKLNRHMQRLRNSQRPVDAQPLATFDTSGLGHD